MEADVAYLNAKIGYLESNLNDVIPVITSMKAAFVRGTNKRFAIFGGQKYGRQSVDPSMYCCTYDADTTHADFGLSFLTCDGMIVLNENGFLQPGSFPQHYHGLLEGASLFEL